MLDDTLRIAATKQNQKLCGVLKKISLNLITKWRNIREANDYADKLNLRPKLIERF